LSIEVEHKEKEKDRIDWRRSKVQELNSQGYSQREIAQMLQVSNGTVNKDLSILREQAKSIIKRYIDERLPEEYEKCMVGLNAILREAWTTSQQTEDKREKIQALSLAVSDRSKDKENLTSSTGNSNEDDRDESNKPDYDEDKDQLEEEQGQQTGEITTATFVGTTIIAFALRKKLIQKMN
jgi:predicted transcriptional regulator